MTAAYDSENSPKAAVSARTRRGPAARPGASRGPRLVVFKAGVEISLRPDGGCGGERTAGEGPQAATGSADRASADHDRAVVKRPAR